MVQLLLSLLLLLAPVSLSFTAPQVRVQPFRTAPSRSGDYSSSALLIPSPHHPTSLPSSLLSLPSLITGGIAGGALHAIAGPDHLAALLPSCVGQRWWRAGRIGALWGVGHGISATILGVTMYAFKTRLSKR